VITARGGPAGTGGTSVVVVDVVEADVVVVVDVDVEAVFAVVVPAVDDVVDGDASDPLDDSLHAAVTATSDASTATISPRFTTGRDPCSW
jgi:hypothetical protein